MARKLRLQYEGAVYHVISRGNYRAYVFAQDHGVESLAGAALEHGKSVPPQPIGFRMPTNTNSLLTVCRSDCKVQSLTP